MTRSGAWAIARHYPKTYDEWSEWPPKLWCSSDRISDRRGAAAGPPPVDNIRARDARKAGDPSASCCCTTSFATPAAAGHIQSQTLDSDGFTILTGSEATDSGDEAVDEWWETFPSRVALASIPRRRKLVDAGGDPYFGAMAIASPTTELAYWTRRVAELERELDAATSSPK
jgi:hypothetical protein